MTQATLERVEAAMTQLGYQANAAAAAMRTSRTKTLGFLILDENQSYLADPLTSQLIAGVGDVAREQGYGLLIQADRPSAGGRQLMVPIRQGRIDGAFLYLAGPRRSRLKRIREVRGMGIPLVVFDEPLRDPSVIVVRTSERETSRALTKHLLDRGHRRIAFIAIRLPWANVEQRGLGYHDAHRDQGLEPDPELEIYDAEWQASGGTEMAKRLLMRRDPPTAIMCGSDLLALGAIRAVREAGLAVPRDVAVTGFDDFNFAEHVYPPLTTVRVPAYRQAHIAAALLFRQLRGEPVPKTHVVLQNEVILRESG